jgi:hypothetical protein
MGENNTTRFQETILLVEADNAVRAVTVTQRNVLQIVERLHLDPRDPSKITVRVWINRGGERDLHGKVRVFREERDTPAETPEAENPVFDELSVKIPLTKQ